MFGAMSLGHWIIVIAVVTILFGRNKISGLLSDLGQGIKQLRSGLDF